MQTIRQIIRLSLVSLLACGVGACSSDSMKIGALSAGVLSVSVCPDNYAIEAGEGSARYDTGYNIGDDEVSLTLSTVNSGETYTHTWESLAKFPQGEYYLAGQYKLTAQSGNILNEGFDKPTFFGTRDIDISEGKENIAEVELTLSNALVRVSYDESLSAYFSSVSAIIHTPGGLYHNYAANETRLLCLKPGLTDIMLDVTLPDSRQVRFMAYEGLKTESRTLYEITVGSEGASSAPFITVTTPQGEKSIELTEDFIMSDAPDISTSWDEDRTLVLPEGNTPADPYTVTVKSADGTLSSLLLSTLSVPLSGMGMPDEVDLLNPTESQREALSRLGLVWNADSRGGTVNFNGLLGNLVYIDERGAMSSFSLVATSKNGRSSQPATLRVDTYPVDIEVLRVDTVIMCVNKANISVRCRESGFKNHVEVETKNTSGEWAKIDPLNITPAGEDTYTLSFDVDEGSSPLETRILYCDEVRSTFSIPRGQPQFTIEVDAYATSAAIRVIPVDESLLKSIASAVHVYIDGKESPIYSEIPDRGILSVIGLSPNTSYSFTATMMSKADDKKFTPAVVAVTEGIPQLPNADFEERTDGVVYDNLPSGGKYSQTVVEMFNWQHSTSYGQEIPKQWANTNAKTFCESSDVSNTWYMQPSVALTRQKVFSQSFAVELTSVGFDPHGEPIPNYTQTGTPYLDYSPIVPSIAYKAAGKLFLGKYSFDPATMTENYDEGIAWNSRPSSLNGYYCYFPLENDRSDCGLVRVEVLGQENGEEIVIASGTSRLTLALSYTAFSVPLSYNRFGVKATRIKVMFSSSSFAGSIAGESAAISLTYDLMTATATGGKLWIDNVTLAY